MIILTAVSLFRFQIDYAIFIILNSKFNQLHNQAAALSSGTIQSSWRLLRSILNHYVSLNKQAKSSIERKVQAWWEESEGKRDNQGALKYVLFKKQADYRNEPEVKKPKRAKILFDVKKFNEEITTITLTAQSY